MGYDVKAHLTNQRKGPEAKVKVSRPDWNSIFNKYPKSASYDANYNNIYADAGYASVTSATRVSIALTGDESMKERLSEASGAVPVPVNNLLGIDKLIKDVRILRDWLESKDVWGRADNKFYYETHYPFRIIHHEKNENGNWDNVKIKTNSSLWGIAKPKLKDRTGIFIMTGNKENLAALWDGQKLVGGYKINEWFNKDDKKTEICFWELEYLKISEVPNVENSNGFDMSYNISFEEYDSYGNPTGHIINYADCELCNRGDKTYIYAEPVGTSMNKSTDEPTNQNVIKIQNIGEIKINRNATAETMVGEGISGVITNFEVISLKTRGTKSMITKTISSANNIFTGLLGLEEAIKYFKEDKPINGMFTVGLTMVKIQFGSVAVVALAAKMPVLLAVGLVAGMFLVANDMGQKSIEERFDPSILRFTKPNQKYRKDFVTKTVYLERLGLTDTTYR